MGRGNETVTGSGFVPGEKVTLYLDSVAAATKLDTTKTKSGSFTDTVTIAGAEHGAHTIIAVGNLGSSATDLFTLDALVSVKSTPVKAGTGAKATLAGFTQRSWWRSTSPVQGLVPLYRPGLEPLTTSAEVVTKSTGSAAGTASATAIIPKGTTAGTYLLVAHGLLGSNACASVVVK